VHGPAARVLTVLELLQSRRTMSARELARRLEVDERTVRRYVATLQGMGMPVEGERGRYGGYALKPGYKLPPLMFTDEEALGLALGLLAARRAGLAEVAPAVEGALAKLERVMPEPVRGRVRALEDIVTAVDARPAALAAGSIVLTLSTAVRESRRVRIRYSSSSGETGRDIDPYAVIQREGYWYAFGYCHLREDVRLFRVDRVLEAEPLERTFVRPPEMDSPEQVLAALAVTGDDRWSVEVLLEATAEEVRPNIPAIGMALEEDEQGVVLRASTSDLDWVAHVLAGLYCAFVVRKPPELREALRRRAADLLAQAEATEEG
jgi:predicted DNA-binding transcriptional regulator YafY